MSWVSSFIFFFALKENCADFSPFSLIFCVFFLFKCFFFSSAVSPPLSKTIFFPNFPQHNPTNESIPAYPMLIGSGGTTDLSEEPNTIGILRNGVSIFRYGMVWYEVS